MSASRLFDDLSRFAGGTMGFASSLRAAIKDEIKSRVEELADRMELVTRDEHQRLEMSLRDALKRIEVLETEKGAAAKAPNPLKTKKKKD